MKNKFKFITFLIAVLVMISSFCFAEGQEQTPIEPRNSDVEQINITDEAVTTNLENESADVETEEIAEEPEIYEGDLYIFENTVNMDKLVDGNVYIVGNDVTITGQIAGNLFVMAENLTIGDETSSTTYNGYVFYNIYALANKATLYSSCYDLYISGNDITIENSFYAYRDIKIAAKNANLFATVGRNVNAGVRNLNLKKDDSSYASIYGDLNYISAKELDEEILNSSVNGSYYFTKERTSSINFSKIILLSLISLLISLLILVVVIVLIIKLILYVIKRIKFSKPNKEVNKVEEKTDIDDTKTEE